MKMKFALLLGISLSAVACTSTEDELPTKQKSTTSKPEDLIVIKDGIYSQYYEGMKQVKFQGPQDSEGKRHGVWYYYSENGMELSITDYSHGNRNGLTIVKHPNGALHYTGEYRDDQEIGVWKTYDQTGKLVNEKDYGL